MDSFCIGSLNCRDDFVNLLPSEETVLPAVGIETCHANPGLFQSKVPACMVCNAYDLQHPLLLHPVAGFPQGYVGRYVHHPDILMGQHHGVLFGSCHIGIHFGVA